MWSERRSYSAAFFERSHSFSILIRIPFSHETSHRISRFEFNTKALRDFESAFATAIARKDRQRVRVQR